MSQTPAQHSTDRWSPVQIRLHWLVAALLLLQWWSGDSMHSVMQTLEQQQSLSALQFLTSTVHSYLGIGILLLMLVRIRLRLVNRDQTRAAVSDESNLRQRLAGATHFGLYLVILVLAVSGILTYYDVLPGAAVAHHWAGWALVVLVSVHILAAIYHGWYRRDGVVARMWPDSWPKR